MTSQFECFTSGKGIYLVSLEILCDPGPTQVVELVLHLLQQRLASPSLLLAMQCDEHDRPMLNEYSSRSLENGGLGTFHIHLDEIWQSHAVFMYGLIQSDRSNK